MGLPGQQGASAPQQEEGPGGRRLYSEDRGRHPVAKIAAQLIPQLDIYSAQALPRNSRPGDDGIGVKSRLSKLNRWRGGRLCPCQGKGKAERSETALRSEYQSPRRFHRSPSHAWGGTCGRRSRVPVLRHCRRPLLTGETSRPGPTALPKKRPLAEWPLRGPALTAGAGSTGSPGRPHAPHTCAYFPFSGQLLCSPPWQCAPVEPGVEILIPFRRQKHSSRGPVLFCMLHRQQPLRKEKKKATQKPPHSVQLNQKLPLQ